MAAKLGLALTQNSSPTPLANRRRVAQIAVSKGRAFGRPPQRAKYPIVPSARRNGRNSRPTAMAPVAAPRGWTAGAIYCDVIHSMRGASRMPRPAVGGVRKGRHPPPADGVGTAALRLRRGGCAICGWRLERWGISRRARRGCFAGCGQRVFRPLRRATGALPLDPRIFSRKNSVKAFNFL